MRLGAVAAAAGGAAAATALSVLVASQIGLGAATAAMPVAADATVSATTSPLYAGGYQDPARGSAMTASVGVVPTHLSIPAIGVETGLERLAVGSDGRLAAPVDFDTAGWFAGGVVPGDIGPAIIAGHVDSITDAAVFYRIAELRPGDEVRVERSDGTTVVFTVTRTEQSAKAAFPTSDVYSPTPQADLRLITCAGDFDASIGHYTDNLIVFATRTG